MSGVFDPALQRCLAALALPGLLIGHRMIQAGDENALHDAEVASLPSRVPEARRASGAARIIARELLARLGHTDTPIARGDGGEPLWPSGIVGSLAHDGAVAVAAVGLERDFSSIGVDVEPMRDLPADMIDLVATPAELARIDRDPGIARLLFAAKEAAYKAAYRSDRTFLDFPDIEVDLVAHTAVTRTGQTLALRYCMSPRIVALALIPA